MNAINDVLNRRKFQVFILAFSVLLFFITLLKTSPGAPESSAYWYISSLYWTFWPGLLLSVFGILLSVREERKYLGLMSVLIPVLYLYTLPNMVHDMVPVFDVYHVIPNVLSIMETGHWDMSVVPFPGSHIYQASQLLVLDVGNLSYARFFPTLLASTIVLFIFTISRIISSKWAPIAPMMFLAFNWYMEYHLARQPFGMMIWAAFWLVMFLYIDKKNYCLGIMAAMVLFAIVPSHPGMTVIVAFNLIALAFVTLISFKKKLRWDYLYPSLPVCVAFIISFIFFYTYVPGINETISFRYEDILEGTFELSLGGPATTSYQYAFVNRLRMAAGFLQSLIGLVAFYIFYKYDPKKALFLAAWFFSCYGWFLHTFTHPEGRNIERGFLAAIVPASILVVALLKYYTPKNIQLKELVKVSTVVMLIAFLILVPITKNSIDAIETPSLSSYSAGRFAQVSFTRRVFVTDMHQGMFRYIESTVNESIRFSGSGHYPVDQSYGYRIPRTTNPNLSPILFTDYFNNYISVRYGNTTAVNEIHRYEEIRNRNSIRIYDSGGSRIYIVNK